MKKVCILQNGLANGGTDTFVVNLCKYIDKNNYDITVVNPSENAQSEVKVKEILSSGAKIVHTSPLIGLNNTIRHFILLYKLLKKGHFDVFQTNVDLFNGPNLFVAWLARVPIRVCHSHNSNQNRVTSGKNSFVNQIYQNVMRWMCWNFSNRRCGCSDLANDFLYKGHHWENSSYPVIIYNPVDIEKFKSKIDIPTKKNELGLSVTKKYILTIGRFISQKNPMYIIEILHDVFGCRDDIDMIWIGEGGDLEESVKEKIDKHNIRNRVHFLSGRNDVNEIMQCADVFILPSKFEGLGIVLIEAQAAGLQCIASDTIPTLSSCGGVEYLPIEKENIQSWVKSILDIVEGKCSKKIELNALDKFSAFNTAKQVESVFKS